jgi:hypothetical protein
MWFLMLWRRPESLPPCLQALSGRRGCVGGGGGHGGRLRVCKGLLRRGRGRIIGSHVGDGEVRLPVGTGGLWCWVSSDEASATDDPGQDRDRVALVASGSRFWSGGRYQCRARGAERSKGMWSQIWQRALGRGGVGSVSSGVELAHWRRSATRRDRADVGAAEVDMRRTAGRSEHNRREGTGAVWRVQARERRYSGQRGSDRGSGSEE